MNIFLTITTIISIIIFIILICIDQRNIINGVVLQIALISLIGAISIDSTKILSIIYNIFYIMCFIIGIALLINGIKVIKKEGFNLTHALPIAFGIGSIIVAIDFVIEFFIGLRGNVHYVFFITLLERIVIYIPVVLIIFLIYSIVYSLLPKKKNVDYIIVLGAGLCNTDEVTPLLKGRINKAIEYYNKGNKKAKFIVSGGQGEDEVISEAEAMKKYLIKNGIKSANVILEDKSTTTYENLDFSKKIMKKDGKKYSCIITTNNYHVLRVAMIAKKLKINGQVIGGKTAFYYLPAAFFREYIAVIFNYKMILFIYVLFQLGLSIFNFYSI